jgi:hypothetical protein
LKFWRHRFINLILNFVVGIQFLLFLLSIVGFNLCLFSIKSIGCAMHGHSQEGISKVPFQCPLNQGGHPTNVLDNVVHLVNERHLNSYYFYNQSVQRCITQTMFFVWK